MSNFDVRVDPDSAAALSGKLKRIMRPVGPAVGEIAMTAAAETRRAAKPHPSDLGTIANSVRVESSPGTPLHAAVRVGRPNAQEVDVGRRGGSTPTIAQIFAWAKSHGLVINPFRMVRAISARGTKGVGFIAKGRAAGAKDAERALDKAARKIEGDFGR